MEQHAIIIPEQIPSYLMANVEAARAANEDAIANIGAGAMPRIKASGKEFVLVDGNGKEEVIKAGELMKGPDDNLYLATVILRAKKDFQKAFYLKKFNPNADEANAPDCFSNDGTKPDSTIANPMCDNCAQCPKNQFGTGVDQNGAATDGKACSDAKILAAMVPKKGVHKLRLMPSALKNFRLYVKSLSDKGIPLHLVYTLVGFQPGVSYPIFTFQFGGFIAQEHAPKIEAMRESSEVMEIINDRLTAKAAPAPAPVAQAPVAQAPVAPAPVAQAPVAPAPVAQAPVAPAPVAQASPALDLGLDAPAPAAQPQVQSVLNTTADADLAASLGL